MKFGATESNAFSMDEIPVPSKLNKVILSMITDPRLSPFTLNNGLDDTAGEPEMLDPDEYANAGLIDAGNGKIFSMNLVADHEWLSIDAEVGSQMLVAQAVRKLACYGGVPMAISCLLYHVEVAGLLEQNTLTASLKGFDEVVEKLDLKVASRQIAYDYNGENIPPILMISLFGNLNEGIEVVTPSLKKKGDLIFMLGRPVNDIAGSEYLRFVMEEPNSPLPWFDLDWEKHLLELIPVMSKKGLVVSARSIEKGGLFFTLLRSGWANGLGFDITSDAEIRKDAFLFGEAQGRVVVSVSPAKGDDFVDFMRDNKIPFFTLGHVTKGEIRIDDESFGFVDKIGYL